MILPWLVFGSMGSAVASGLPADFIVETKCITQGLIEVCAINQRAGRYPRLKVRYRGSLLNSHKGRIDAWVSLNGRAQIFRMQNSNYAEAVTIGGLKAEPAEADTAVMSAARGRNGEPRPWDVAVAFIGAGSEWDSRNGANYRFRFE